MSATIDSVRARRVWDSRGRPTIELEVRAGGVRGRGIAPAGASRGSAERFDLRDGGSYLGGFDVQHAIVGVHELVEPVLLGQELDIDACETLDDALVAADGTPDRSLIGANTLVATSMALAWTAAALADQPLWACLAAGSTPLLPVPEIQIFGGGAHAARGLDLQDLMVVAIGAGSFAEALEWTAEVYRAAGDQIGQQAHRRGVADEGGWWPWFDSNEGALIALVAAVERAGFAPGRDVAISVDVAATELYHDGHYVLALDNQQLDRDAMIDKLDRWVRDFPIVAIEDPLDESDLEGTAIFTRKVARHDRRVLVVADDLVVTNDERVRRAAALGAANAALIKPNQAGTLAETRRAFDAARAAGWRTIVSARSGETEDVTICHLAVGWSADLLKVGSIARGERTAKWNEMIRLEEELTGVAVYDAQRPWR